MKIEANSIEEYISKLPEERQPVIERLREEIQKNIPQGFNEEMNYGMIGWVVPHSIYPSGYHCTPELPLPYMNLASQKNHVAVYHSGIYASEKIMSWFLEEYNKEMSRKPDMGKSCIRFKNINKIPYALIGELAGVLTTQEWIDIYEKNIKR